MDHPSGTPPATPQAQLGRGSTVAVVVANMIGTGIFTTSGFIIQEVHSPWLLLLGWLLGGFFALTGALCYGELGARFPRAGGEYVFLRASLGEAAGFLAGWISLLVGFSAPIAAAAVACAAYLLAGSPWHDGGWVLHLQGWPVLHLTPATLIATCLILIFSLVHSHSLTLGSRLQNVLTVFKVALVLLFIGAALVAGRGSWDHLGPWPGGGAVFSGRFASALIFISFAYSGWNAAAYLGEEIARPRRTIPLALISGTLLVAGLYLGLNLVFVYALPPAAMAGVLEVGEKAAVALFGPTVSQVFAKAIALGLLSLISVMILTGPRVYLAMARDGLFFPALARLSGPHHTPRAAILLQAGLAVLMVLTATFEKLLLFIGVTLSVFALLTVVGLFRLRRRHPDSPGYRTIGYPWTPLVFSVGQLWIIGYFVGQNPVVAAASLGAVLLGLLLYAVFKRQAAAPKLPATCLSGQKSADG